jgi:hypothetical protein
MSKNTTTPVAVMTAEQKYSIADKLALAYGNKLSKLLEDDTKRNVAFGIVINTVNANGETLSSALGDENATHITNLTIQRIQQAHSLVVDAF